jgi:hypothetical protein
VDVFYKIRGERRDFTRPAQEFLQHSRNQNREQNKLQSVWNWFSN